VPTGVGRPAAALPSHCDRLAALDQLEAGLAVVGVHEQNCLSYRSYSWLVNKHLVPALGHIQLTKLQLQQVHSAVNSKVTEGLSPRSADYMRAVLRRALKEAMHLGLVHRNVAELTDPPQ
jgi:hypothetical protein